MTHLYIYDTTLRDGSQGEGVSFSMEDKLSITRRLDEIGVPFIEGGWPGSNDKDRDFFRAVRDVPLRQAQIAAFGSTGAPARSAGPIVRSRPCWKPRRRS